MKIGIVGGGPGGLYLALLLKKHDPSHEVRLVEQNPPDATYGWGIVFSGRALSFLEETDPDSFADIDRCLERWDDQAIVHRDQKVVIDGFGFSGMSRLELLRILQEHCRRHGVQMRFQQRLTDLSLFRDCDLVVGADGVNSVVRDLYAAHFQPSAEVLTNKYVWYGTTQLFDTLTLTFRTNEHGAFVAHHYRHSPHQSTFVVECDAETWANAGFAFMSEEESRAYCERVFAPDLDGHPLLSNRSLWINYRAITNQRWSYRNIVLLGDALRTVHFSIGSGTRMALEDAIHLFHALRDTPDVPTALQRFEETRRPGVERFLGVAARSFVWYEHFRDKLHLDPLPFAYDYVMRTGLIEHAKLRERSPRFAAAYEAYMASR